MYEKDDLQQVLHILNINIKMSTVKIKKVKGFKGSENTEAKNYNWQQSNLTNKRNEPLIIQCTVYKKLRI